VIGVRTGSREARGGEHTLLLAPAEEEPLVQTELGLERLPPFRLVLVVHARDARSHGTEGTCGHLGVPVVDTQTDPENETVLGKALDGGLDGVGPTATVVAPDLEGLSEYDADVAVTDVPGGDAASTAEQRRGENAGGAATSDDEDLGIGQGTFSPPLPGTPPGRKRSHVGHECPAGYPCWIAGIHQPRAEFSPGTYWSLRSPFFGYLCTPRENVLFCLSPTTSRRRSGRPSPSQGRSPDPKAIRRFHHGQVRPNLFQALRALPRQVRP